MDDPDLAALAERSTVNVHAPLERIRGRVAAALFGGAALPEAIGRFTIDRELGSGGMGIVYAAHDPQLDRTIAVKVLRQQGEGPSEGSRLLREAQAMARLRHRNVLTVYEVGDHEGQIYVAMEYALGGTLAEWIGAGDRPWREVLAILIPAGRGLAAAHQAGLVHRDFKPANVLLDGDGNALVSDFGLARAGAEVDALPGEIERTQSDDDSVRLLQVVLTRTGALVGTPAYMSPEQFAGAPATPRSDQFAFAVVLYEALFGRRPFAGHSVGELVASVERGEVAPPPRIHAAPRRVRAAILRGLSREPARRFPSMNALLDELEGAIRGAAWHRPLRLVAGVASAIMVTCGVLYGLERPPEASTATASSRTEVTRTVLRTTIDESTLPSAIACDEGSEECVVDELFARYFLDNPAALAHHAKIIPALEEGELRGYKLYGLRADSAFKRLGLKNGDLITALDDVRLSGPEVAVAAVQRGLDERRIVIAFTRKGEAGRRVIHIAAAPEVPAMPAMPGFPVPVPGPGLPGAAIAPTAPTPPPGPTPPPASIEAPSAPD